MNKESVKNLIIALVFGILAFIVLIVINNKVSSKDTNMIWSVKEIPQGLTLTKDNINDYVKTKPTNDSVKNGEIVIDTSELIGKTAVRDIKESELLQESFFIKGEDIKSQFKNPVLVSFTATDFSSTANGVIRAGDRINIVKIVDKNSVSSATVSTATTPSEDSGDTSNVTADVPITTATTSENLIVEDAYVVNAFDSSGSKIEPGDTTAIAVSFNIYIEKENETAFYNDVNDKNIAISKIEPSAKKE